MRVALIDVGGTLWSESGGRETTDGGTAPSTVSGNPLDRHQATWARRLLEAGVPHRHVATLCRQLAIVERSVGVTEYFDVWQAIDAAMVRADVHGLSAEQVRRASCLPARIFTAPLPGAAALLETIKARGLGIVIVSNAVWRTAADYWVDFRWFGMADSIDSIVSSVDVFWRKPSRGFFEIALQKAGVPANDRLIIGNSETNDVAPGKMLGMTAFRMAIEEPLPANSHADCVYGSLRQAVADFTRLSS